MSDPMSSSVSEERSIYDLTEVSLNGINLISTMVSFSVHTSLSLATSPSGFGSGEVIRKMTFEGVVDSNRRLHLRHYVGKEVTIRHDLYGNLETWNGKVIDYDNRSSVGAVDIQKITVDLVYMIANQPTPIE